MQVCLYISQGHLLYANMLGFGSFPWFSELLVQCAKISFRWGGGGRPLWGIPFNAKTQLQK